MPSSASPADPHTLNPSTASHVWDAQPQAAELARLDGECFVPAWGLGTYQEWTAEPRMVCWVLRARGAESQAVAFAVCRRVDAEAEVLRLGVRPVWRRRGWGRALMEGVLERLRAQGARRVFLEVRAGNTAAQALYRAVGFQVIGRRARYYQDPPEDAVVMGRE